MQHLKYCITFSNDCLMLNARGLSEGAPLLAKPYIPYTLKPYTPYTLKPCVPRTLKSYAELQALQACGSCRKTKTLVLCHFKR